MDPATMQPVPADGETMGEIMFRGNITMKGYLKNPKATRDAFAGGWFHSGDLAVVHPDGYVKIKDRSKDIIISGGENISSLEVEDVLYRHPAVLAAAVVAMPDEKWGETPVRLRRNAARSGARRNRRSSSSASSASRSSRRLERWSSASCRRPRPGRFRNSCCVRGPSPHEPSTHERDSATRARRSCCARTATAICTLTMNQPSRMNLLTRAMLEALQGAFDTARERHADPRRHPRCGGQGLLRWTRPEGNPAARGAGEDQRALHTVQPHDAGDHWPAAAGDRARAGRRGGRGLPARCPV